MGVRRIERVKGLVEGQTVYKDTASEHQGIILTTNTGEHLLLQRIGGNPFSDPVTRSLTGQEVLLEGYRLRDQGIFRFTRVCDEMVSKTGSTRVAASAKLKRK